MANWEKLNKEFNDALDSMTSEDWKIWASKRIKQKIRTMKCKCCQREQELRLGFCFDCVESESIIVDGVDMFDKEVPKIEGLSLYMSKVHYILQKYGLVKNM
jgi:hypothetical protein